MRSTRKLALLAAAVAAACGLLAACGGGDSSGGTPQSGGVATFAEKPGTQPNWIFAFLDQAHNSGYATGDMQVLMYRPLYWFGTADGGTGLNTVKSLAAAPVYSENNTRVVVNLKPFKWSNGESVTADDVVFWMNLMKAEKANWALYAPGEFPDNVASYTETGPEQVTFQLTGSYSPTWFTGNELFQITPLPLAWDKTSDSAAPGSGGCAKSVDSCAAVYQYLYNKSKDLNGYATDPLWQVVDGPWHLKSYNADGNIDYLPNAKYSGTDKPRISEYRMLPFTTDAAEYNVLRAGNNTVTMGYTIPQDLPQRVGNSPQPATNPLAPNYNLVPGYGWGWAAAALNYDNGQLGGVFQQLYVRQALQQVLDQNTIDRVVYRGFAVPTVGPVNTAPDNQYIAPIERGAGPYPFDPNPAKQRLTSHGWTEQNGVMTCTKPGTGADQCGQGVAAGTRLSITALYSNGTSATQQIMQQWKTDAAKAGIVLNIKPEQFDQLQNDTSSCHTPGGPGCDWQIAYIGYNQYYAVPTAEQLLLPGAPENIMNVNDPKLSSLIDATLHSGSSSAFNDYETYAAQQLPGQINMPMRYYIEATATNIRNTTEAYDVVSTGRDPEDWYFVK